MVMDTDLGATKAAKEALGLIGAGFTVRIAFLVIDALRKEAIVQHVPTARFVGMNDRIGMDTGGGGGGGSGRGKLCRLGWIFSGSPSHSRRTKNR